MRFLIDTGASVSAINPDICGVNLKKSKEPFTIYTLNSKINFNYVVEIKPFEEFGPAPTKFQFIEYKFSNFFDGLIGNDILSLYQTKIDLTNKTLQVNNKILPIYYNIVEENGNPCANLEELINFAHERTPSKNILDEIRVEHLNVEEKEKLTKLISKYKSKKERTLVLPIK